MPMISIDGVSLPNPSSYTVKLADLDSDGTTRSETGKLRRDRVRAGVYSIDLTWSVTKSLLKQITDKLAPEKFTVVFFDPTSSADQTAEMYAGNKEGKLVSYTDENSPAESRWELTTSLIEY